MNFFYDHSNTLGIFHLILMIALPSATFAMFQDILLKDRHKLQAFSLRIYVNWAQKHIFIATFLFLPLLLALRLPHILLLSLNSRVCNSAVETYGYYTRGSFPCGRAQGRKMLDLLGKSQFGGLDRWPLGYTSWPWGTIWEEPGFEKFLSLLQSRAFIPIELVSCSGLS